MPLHIRVGERNEIFPEMQIVPRSQIIPLMGDFHQHNKEHVIIMDPSALLFPINIILRLFWNRFGERATVERTNS